MNRSRLLDCMFWAKSCHTFLWIGALISLVLGLMGRAGPNNPRSPVPCEFWQTLESVEGGGCAVWSWVKNFNDGWRYGWTLPCLTGAGVEADLAIHCRNQIRDGVCECSSCVQNVTSSVTKTCWYSSKFPPAERFRFSDKTRPVINSKAAFIVCMVFVVLGTLCGWAGIWCASKAYG